MNLQVAYVKSCKSVHVSSIHYHMQALSTRGCVFVYKVELGLQEDDFIELFATQELTNEDSMELEAQTKDEER